jgi:triphosphoribosyl-dephospho-CoA synthase
MLNPQQLTRVWLKACELDVTAFKPGNVSIYANGHDMTVADFRLSAKVSAQSVCNPDFSIGEKIYYAVKATREAVHCNTNLGIVLLCAPLIQAASQTTPESGLRQTLTKMLTSTTIEDAEWVFKAIALASPGGLGKSELEDVNHKPGVTLTEAMRIASPRDRIALQFLTNFKDIFDSGVLTYNAHFDKWGQENWAVVAVYAHFLSQYPDSHIERKYGSKYSRMVSSNMINVLNALSKTENPEQLLALLFKIDQDFKSMGVNPGTTADMSVATVLTVLLEDLLTRSF